MIRSHYVTVIRPDDIHTLYSGKTVEINNTDAEGRLVLGKFDDVTCGSGSVDLSNPSYQDPQSL